MALRLPAFFLMLALMASMGTSAVQKLYPITLVVYNSVFRQGNLTFNAEIAYRGILLGAMKRLENNTNNFKFTITENPDYGPFLESVNGLKGDEKNQTYWQLVAQLQNGTLIFPDVGVGCYIPNPQDRVVLKYTKWNTEAKTEL